MLNKFSFDGNNERHGEWLWYHDNGQLDCRVNYVHGIRHGLYETYYLSGKLRYRRNYFNDVKHGLEEGYNYDGVLLHRGYRNMGIRIGYWYFLRTKEYYLWLI